MYKRQVLMRIFTIPLVITMFGVAAQAAEPTITREERANVIKLLEDSEAEFLGLVSGPVSYTHLDVYKRQA